MGISRTSRDEERGQILVIVAGGALTLILLMGLVLDAGVAFFNRRDGQNASDLMALAGTKFVADVHRGEAQPDPTITTTHEAISRSAMANNCDAAGAVPCTWEAWFVAGSASGPVDIGPAIGPGSPVPSNALGVRTAVRRQPQTFVIGFAGISNWDVSTQATATAEAIRSAPAGQLLPIALKNDPTTPYQPGQVYDLTDGSDLPGGFGYLTWGGSPSAPVLGQSMCNPDNPAFTLPAVIEGSSGKTNSNEVRGCLDDWIASGQTILIPIYSTSTGNGAGSEYTVIGIAAFVITERSQPGVDNIRGYFVEIYTANPVPAGVGSLPPGPLDTSYNLALIK